jgi:hypothetical protein
MSALDQRTVETRGGTVTVFGQRLRVHHYDTRADVVWLYGWRDVLARPVTRTWVEASLR